MIDNLVYFDQDNIHHYDQHIMEQNHINFFQYHNDLKLQYRKKKDFFFKISLHLIKHCRRPSHFTFLYDKHFRVCISNKFGCEHV
jgi:hypothetical protein